MSSEARRAAPPERSAAPADEAPAEALDIPHLSELAEVFATYQRELGEKVSLQHGVPTWLDNSHSAMSMYLGAFAAEGSLVQRTDESRAAARHACAELSSFLGLRSRERFARLADRVRLDLDPLLAPHVHLADASTRSEIPPGVMSRCQGAHAPITWRGRNLFKLSFDIVLYTMLVAELRPRTVIELGSGDGGSAAWFHDIAAAQGVDASVVSFDIRPPDASFPGVRFLHADLRTPDKTIDRAALEREPHPWLVVEDAHVDTLGIMRFFHPLLAAGDYLVVEDSGFGKLGEAILPFFRAHGEDYRVDTKYTDFFGRNATCAPDSIFVRV